MPELTPRVVFDCNLFVQGIANRNSPARKALRLFFNGDVSLFVSSSWSNFFYFRLVANLGGAHFTDHISGSGERLFEKLEACRDWLKVRTSSGRTTIQKRIENWS